MERASGKHILELPTLSFIEGARMVENLVQSLLLPIDILKMYETDPKSYKRWASSWSSKYDGISLVGTLPLLPNDDLSCSWGNTSPSSWSQLRW